MNILLTNDDGFLAPGLTKLRTMLEKYGKVFVIAPHFHQSGKSAGITFFNGLTIHTINENTWTVEGTPADCVIVATQVIKEPIDLIVSGVNNGFNLSYDALYSGTCGACYQALMFKMKSIALSMKHFKEDPWQINEDMENAFKFCLDNNLFSSDYFLNLNMPEPTFEKALGIKITKLYPRLSKFEINLHNKPKDQYDVVHVYDIDVYNNISEEDMIYDIPCTRRGFISITPLKLPSCDEEAYEKLLKLSN